MLINNFFDPIDLIFIDFAGLSFTNKSILRSIILPPESEFGDVKIKFTSLNFFNDFIN